MSISADQALPSCLASCIPGPVRHADKSPNCQCPLLRPDRAVSLPFCQHHLSFMMRKRCRKGHQRGFGGNCRGIEGHIIASAGGRRAGLLCISRRGLSPSSSPAPTPTRSPLVPATSNLWLQKNQVSLLRRKHGKGRRV